jgi:hypothetical protein
MNAITHLAKSTSQPNYFLSPSVTNNLKGREEILWLLDLNEP